MPLGLEMHQRYFLLIDFRVILFSCCCCGNVSAKVSPSGPHLPRKGKTAPEGMAQRRRRMRRERHVTQGELLHRGKENETTDRQSRGESKIDFAEFANDGGFKKQLTCIPVSRQLRCNVSKSGRVVMGDFDSRRP